MNKLKGSLAAKILAIILLAASCFALLGAGLGIAFLEEYDAYESQSAAGVRERMIDEALTQQMYRLVDELSGWRSVADAHALGMRFALLDREGNVLSEDPRADETVLHSAIYDVYDLDGGLFYHSDDEPLTMTASGRDWSPEPTPYPLPQGAEEEKADTAASGTRVCQIRMDWTDKSDSGQLSAALRRYESLFPWRWELVAVAVGAFVLAVLLFVFLMAAAGHRDGSGTVTPGFVEKIPVDLLFVLCGAGVSLFVAAAAKTMSFEKPAVNVLSTGLCLACAGLLALLFLMSAALRLKLGVFLDDCLCWRVLRLLWRGIRAAAAACGRLLRGVPLVWRWIPAFLLLFVLDLAFTMGARYSGEPLAVGLLFKWALLGAALLYLALAFQRLRKGAKAIAQGEEQVVVDEKYLIGGLKEHAEDLNHIRDGLSRAVDARMKSERLRTELITNVSHDIKTPLTSIVNYVELLSREEPENEKVREYVAVLQRQSERLRKLTDDLVEASKAATGNLPTNPERLELGVLADQLAGEYGERLADKGLELRVSKPDAPVLVRADPRHLWRMLDNLMGNVLKYAQPGTRVYLDLEREGERAALCLKNISAEPLNVRPEELTERFVRGDAARSTEGSGLGLAIAASLAKLQDIQLELSVDGDLFKVRLLFKTE